MATTTSVYVDPNTGFVQAGLAPFRNAVINGDMRINQRGTSTNLASLGTVAAASPGSWVADRWNVLRTGYVAGGVIGQGTNLTVSDLPFSDTGVKTFARIGRLSGNTSVNAITMQYSMESQDCYRFLGKIVTLSFYYRTGANFSGTSISTAIRTGTGTDEAMRGTFTGITVSGTIASNSFTSWQKITLTCTIGTNINQIGLDIRYIPVGTAGAADYFDITGVQLELGSVATPFEVRPYPVELQLCQRYYEFISAYSAIFQAASLYDCALPYKVMKRKLSNTIVTTWVLSGSTVINPSIIGNNLESIILRVSNGTAGGSISGSISIDSEL